MDLREEIHQLIITWRVPRATDEILKLFEKRIESMIQNNQTELDKSNKRNGTKPEEEHNNDVVCEVCTKHVLNAVKKKLLK